jgi:site-specific DNA-methyltransferase (adenine-specific)
MIYKDQIKTPHIHFCNDDYRNQIGSIDAESTIVVTDPPFNIGYHYDKYNDRMGEEEYYSMLADLVTSFPCVIIHYPEALHKLSLKSGIAPDRVCSWVYNSNTARQHRDIGWYKVEPDFSNTLQPYKNPNDKRIKKRIEGGRLGAKMYDWWNVNQVKNVSKDKTKHPCQMPLEVMKNIVSTLPENKTIFDPFMGSGTTAIACIELGYDFIGCEISKEYYEIAKDRINANEE